MASQYAQFPDWIFGRTCRQLRRDNIREILGLYDEGDYGKRFGVTTPKTRLLKLLVILEKDVSAAETAAITEWLSAPDRKHLETLLHRAMNPEAPAALERRKNNPVIKRDIEEDFEERSLSASTTTVPEFSTFASSIAVSSKRKREENYPLARLNRPFLSNPPNVECTVCMESLAVDAFPKQKISSSCDHQPTACIACLIQSMDTKINNEPHDRITCPECPSKLQYEEIKKFASGNGFQRYLQKSLNSAMELDDNFLHCLGPACETVQAIDLADSYMICGACKFKTCIVHKMPWHTDLTCAEYDEKQEERREQDKASQKLIAETAKTCPNPACGARIEKNGGCEHMTCKKCKHEFCWLCLAPYAHIRRLGNNYHAETCEHHPNQLHRGSR